MASLLIRQLDEEIKSALKRRAIVHGRSMEAEARMILAEAVRSTLTPPAESLYDLAERLFPAPVRIEGGVGAWDTDTDPADPDRAPAPA